MIIDPERHGFTLPVDFKPQVIANVHLICPDNQYIEGRLTFKDEIKNKILVSTLTAGNLYSLESDSKSPTPASSIFKRLRTLKKISGSMLSDKSLASSPKLKVVEEESKMSPILL